MKRIISVLFLILLINLLALLCSAAEAPILDIPSQSCFKLELDSKPSAEEYETVKLTLRFGRLYKSFPKEGITSLKCELNFDSAVFRFVSCSVTQPSGFWSCRHECTDGKVLLYFETDNPSYAIKDCDMFYAELNFSVLGLPEEILYVERAYIYTDKPVCKNQDAEFYGIGGIGYCEINKNTSCSEQPSLPDSSSDTEFSEPEALDFDAFCVENDLIISSDGNVLVLPSPGLILTLPDGFLHVSANGLIKENKAVCTGDTVMGVQNSRLRSLLIAVLGDINGDSIITADDYISIRLHILGLRQLDAERLFAADINMDERVNSTDYILVRRYIFGHISSFS